MKRTLAVVAILALGSTAALAQGRMSTTNMTCAQARGMVATHGAIVLGTGGATYERFVRDSSFCQRLETAQTAYARTADVAQCPVGGSCVEMEFDLYH